MGVSAAVSAATAAAVAAAAPQQQTAPLGVGGPHSSAGSVSSTGGISPTSPHRGKEEECSLHGRSSTEGEILFFISYIIRAIIGLGQVL